MTNKCFFCEDEIEQEDWKAHISKCSFFASMSNVKCVQKGKKRFVEVEDVLYCVECGTKTNNSELINHKKSCVRISKSNKSMTEKKNSEQQMYLEEDKEYEQLITASNKQPIEKINIENACLDLTISTLKPEIHFWVDKNRSFTPSVLFHFYKKYLEKQSSELSLILPEIKLEQFPRSREFKWTNFIFNPSEVFDRELILNRTKDYDVKVRIKIYKYLNRIYENYPIAKFVIPKNKSIENEVENENRVIMPYEFYQCVKVLLETADEKMCHLAIDLMIMFQSGLRFPSSWTPKFIENILSLNENKTYFTIKSTKTGSDHIVILDLQLIQLIKLAKWKTHSMELDFYRRMINYLPFRLSEMRRGFMIFLQKQEKALDIQLTQHKNIKSLQYYVKTDLIERHINIKEQLRIPGLQTKCQNTYELDYLKKYALKDQILLEQHWIDRLHIELKNRFSGVECYLFQIQPPIFQVDKEYYENVMNEENSFEIESQESSSSSNEDENENNKKIKQIGQKYNKFIFDNFFEKTISECGKCNQSTFSLKCLNCENILCEKCDVVDKTYFICFCREKVKGSKLLLNNLNTPKKNYKKNILTSRTKSSKGEQGFKPYGSEENEYLEFNELQIMMKKEYEDFDKLDFKIIQDLIHLRGHYFVNTPVEYRIENFESFHSYVENKIQSISSVYFEKYEEFLYFPPLYLKEFGLSNENGEGYGLFARNDIEKFVFVGEYAADVFHSKDTFLCRRKDMIIDYIDHPSPPKSLKIGPILHCGYITLINNLGPLNNCQSLKCIINGQIRIIIYTIKKIKKNEQLGYEYFLKSSFMPPKSTEYLILINENSNCYINVILQLFFMLQSEISLAKVNNEYLKMIKQIFSLKESNPLEIIKHDFFVKETCKLFNFPLGVHQDCSEILIKIFSMIDEEGIKHQSGVIEDQYTYCNTGNHETSHHKQTLSWMKISPKQSIGEFKYTEYIENYNCQECKKKVTCVQETKWLNPKKILFFVLNRFEKKEEKLCKLEHNYNIPYFFNIENSKYKLIYMINHYGQLEGGHYVFVDMQKNVVIDDTNMRTFSTPDTLSAYIVAYKEL